MILFFDFQIFVFFRFFVKLDFNVKMVWYDTVIGLECTLDDSVQRTLTEIIQDNMIHKLLSISLPYGTLVQIFSSICIIFVSFRPDEYRIWLGINLKSLLKCRVGCWSLGISWTIIQYTRNDNHCYWYTSQLFASRVLEN